MVLAVHQDQIVAWEFFEKTATDNAAIDSTRWVNFLNTTLRTALENRDEDHPILLMDNARTHTSFESMDFYMETNLDLVPHPEYLPNLNPPDFDIFNRIKRRLRARRFATPQELKTRVGVIIQELNQDQGPNRMKGTTYLPIRWEHVIKAKGEYIH